MGFISAFGIGFAAPISALAILPLTAANAAPTALGPIDVSITGLRNAKGNVLVCLTANPKAYPDCGKDPKSLKQLLPARPTLEARFEGVAPGTYAIALIHDENSNNRMDVALFLPKEGFGMSQNPPIGMGPPSFKSAKFTYSGEALRLAIRTRYLL